MGKVCGDLEFDQCCYWSLKQLLFNFLRGVFNPLWQQPEREKHGEVAVLPAPLFEVALKYNLPAHDIQRI